MMVALASAVRASATELAVSGMNCSNCARHVAEAIQALPEVATVHVERVVIYRNGVAFYARTAKVIDGRIAVRVPRERVDDFLNR